jgi:hypothetical protein
MKRWLLAVIATFLAGIVALAFAFPAPMLAPGALIPAHAPFADDCFACHAPLRGAVAERCTACHAVAGIGRKTVAGVPVLRDPPLPPFHQGLSDADCMGCHTDHPLPGLVPPHSHSFDHSLLTAAAGADCAGCHRAPADTIHAGITAQCSACHTQATFAAATLDHSRFFALSGPHDAACTTCHTTPGEFGKFTCFGCHAHREADIIAKHREEGITRITNCVACHRDAHAEGGDGGAGGEAGEGDED